MPRADLEIHFEKIDSLINEIETIVPATTYQTIQFRADLAGLLVVAIASAYETCVKDVLFEFANKKHIVFGGFTQRNYEKLSSKVRVNDLRNYCKLFDPDIKIEFNRVLAARKAALLGRVGKDIEKSYEQILDWRHDFAHAGVRATTIEEAAATHRVGKRVLFAFDEAFNTV